MKSFVSFVFLATFFVLGSAVWTKQDMKDALRPMVKECIDNPHVKITDEMKEKLKNEEETDEATKMQMSRCVMIKMGFMNEAGDILKDGIKEKIGSEMKDSAKFDEMMEMCDKTMDTPNHTSYKLMECIKTFQETKCGC